MYLFLVILAVIIFTCIFLNNMSSRLGVPVLLMFIVFGILFGWSAPELATLQSVAVEKVCSTALLFIMFYGGFGTRWSVARPVALEAGLLASLGVAVTAGLVGFFCRLALGWPWIESFLMGAVISSTDAASVFSILRSRRMGLKNRTAPLLEIESGSNDPCSYMMTAILLSVMKGGAGTGFIVWTVFSQIAFGIGIGVLIAQAAVFVLHRVRFSTAGFDSLFILAVAVLSYSLPSLVGGNGYLSAYIVGIVLGNVEFKGRKPLVNFFDGITSLMQILIFFLLGFMCVPSRLLGAFVPAMIIFAFITFVARPAAVSMVLLPFGKYPLKQIGLVSFVGLRGAASIVFAITTMTSGVALENDIFSIVFSIVLVSIALQGSLIPPAAKLFGMIDKRSNVMKTFSDFGEESSVSFGSIRIFADSNWKDRRVKELMLPKSMLLVMVLRGGEKIVPNGDTVLQEDDRVIFCTKSYKNVSETNLMEYHLSRNSVWAGKPLMDYPREKGNIVVMIRRGEKHIIPDGSAVLQAGDVLYIYKNED